MNKRRMIKARLTERRHGQRCPFCHEAVRSTQETTVKGTTAVKEWHCASCGADWEDRRKASA